MKHLLMIITIFFLFMSNIGSAEPWTNTWTYVEVATCPKMIFTWEKTIQMQQGESIDLIRECPEGFVNGMVDIIGRVNVNDACETTGASWCSNSTAVATALGSATLYLRGN